METGLVDLQIGSQVAGTCPLPCCGLCGSMICNADITTECGTPTLAEAALLVPPTLLGPRVRG